MTKDAEERLQDWQGAVILSAVVALVLAITLLAKWNGQNAICQQVAGKRHVVSWGVCYKRVDGDLVRQ